MKGKSRWRSLRTKIIARTFVPTAIILLAVALVTFYSYQQVAANLVLERDQRLVRLSADQLAGEFDEYTRLMSDIARLTNGAVVASSRPGGTLDRARNRLVIFDGGVVVLDQFGSVVAAQPERPGIVGQDWSDREYFRRMIHSPGPVFSNVVADGPEGADVITAAVPITGDQGEFLGALVGMFRTGVTAVSTFYGTIIKQRVGGTANAYLVDANGRVIYHPNADFIGHDFSTLPVVRRVLDGEAGAIRTRSSDGVDIVAGFAPVPDTPWGLITEESWATLTSTTRRYQQFLLLLLALGVAAPAALVTIAVRHMTQPIEELITAAKEVARGNFGQTITADTGDEIEELAEQFNIMSAELEEYYAHLEQRVADRTRELTALYRADEELYRYLRLDQVLDTLVDVAVDIFKADKSALMVWDDDRERLVVRAARGFSSETMTQMSFALGEGGAGRVAAAGEPVVVEDTLTDSRVVRAITDGEGIRSFMHVPINVSGRTFGVFNVSYVQPQAFGGEEQRLFTALAQRAGLAIENAQLYEQAQHAATAEERQRLARELHDAVTQTLFSASLIAEVLPRLWERQPDEGQRRLQELRELTRGALAEMRTLLLELRPAALTETALGDLLRQLGEATTGRARVTVTVTVEGECALAADVQVALYRIAQEALNNVAKHADATQATVSLRCDDGRVELRISDDGRGFDPQDISPDHLGLGIMRERAQTIRAALTIESQVGEGTVLHVRYPAS